MLLDNFWNLNPTTRNGQKEVYHILAEEQMLSLPSPLSLDGEPAVI